MKYLLFIWCFGIVLTNFFIIGSTIFNVNANRANLSHSLNNTIIKKIHHHIKLQKLDRGYFNTQNNFTKLHRNINRIINATHFEKKVNKFNNRLKRNINSTHPQRKLNNLMNETEALNIENLLNPDSLVNDQNLTLLGLLNLNQVSLNKSEQRPKYEITFRILPNMNKIYRDIETQYKNHFVEEFDFKKNIDNSHIVKTPQTWTDNIVTPQNLISNASEVSISVKNDSIEYLIEKFKEMYPVEKWRQHGWFTDDYLYIINEHWLKYPPQSKEAHYILAFIYLFVLAAGIFGNLLVIFMFFKCRSLRTPANILVVNLAVSDLLMMTELPMLVYNSIFEGPALGQTACTVYGFIGGLTGTVSIGTLSAIAFDRYSVVVYPLDPLRAITGLRAKLSVVFAWTYGIFFSIIPALDIGLGKYVPEGFLTSCSFDYLSEEEDAKTFIFAFFLAAWVLPLVIISFCYAKIFHVVIVTRNLGKEAAGNMSSRHCKENEKRKTELKLAGVVSCVIGLFFAAWTPYSIVSLLGIMGYKHLLAPIYSMVPAMCAKLASCLDPFVYVVTHPKFRQECENLFLSKAEQQRRSTMRHGSEYHPNPSVKSKGRDMDITSENSVEVVEMAKVKTSKPLTAEYPSAESAQSNKRGIGLASVSPVKENIKTISSHMVTKGIDASELPKSIEENEDLKPPSWYVKPEFARTNSVKNVVKKIQRLASNDSMKT